MKKGSSGPVARRAAPSSRGAWTVSILLHAAVTGGFVVFALWAPEPPPTVAVFELVTPEKPKLRPMAPKTPEPPAEKPPEARPPEAPKVAPKPAPKPPPEKPKPKPEPKAVRPAPPDTTLPVKETPRENAVLTTTLKANIPSDPRLAFWAGRVKKRVEALWNPPTGVDAPDRARTVVSFEVSRAGNIGGIEIVEGSGNTLLDDLAKRTIQRLERVPPVPENFPGDALKVSYEFIYNAD